MEKIDDTDWAKSGKPSELRGGNPGGDPSSKRRVLTAARREQNRLAQSAYRKRRKEQRKQLKETELQRYETRRLRPLLKRCDGINCSSETPDAIEKSSQSNQQPTDGPTQGDVSIYDKPTSTQPRPACWSETDGSLSSSSDASTSTSVRLDRERTFADLGDDGLQLVPARHRSNKSRTSQYPTNSYDDAPILPDIYLNMLQFVPVTVAHAVFENALSLGFDLPTIANCGVDCISPFYQPTLSSTTDPNALLQYGAASTASFKNTSIPIHLRPTLAQVLIPHHAGLDLIPLPFLRERAIMLSAAMPETFNTWELKLDIYERGGLSIWRQSQSPMERRSNNTYQPWDMRSWEAAPWFLKKWTMIIGDEESEFYKQSIGWQVIREVICSQASLQFGNGEA